MANFTPFSLIFFFLLTKVSLFEIVLSLHKEPKSLTVISKYYQDNDFYYLIPLCLGTPPQCINVLYETMLSHLIINPIPTQNTHHFKIDASSTSQTKKINNFLGKKKEIITDQLMIETLTFPFDFLLNSVQSNRFANFEGVFGFGSDYDPINDVYNYNFSLVKTMNSQRKWKNIFGHKYLKERQHLRLYIGEITDSEFVEKYGNSKNYPKCYISSSNKILNDINNSLSHGWSCMMQKVKIIDDSIIDIPNTSGIVIFSTGYNKISGPLAQGQAIINQIIQNPAINEKCKTVMYDGNKTNLICAWTFDIYSFPTIVFEINGIELGLTPSNIFYKEYDILGGNFVYKGRFSFARDVEYWTVGQPLLREYDMVFDMDEGSVGFWNAETIGVNKDSLVKGIGFIVVLVVVLSIIVGGGIFYLKWKRDHSPEAIKQKQLYNKIEKLQDIEMSK